MDVIFFFYDFECVYNVSHDLNKINRKLIKLKGFKILGRKLD